MRRHVPLLFLACLLGSTPGGVALAAGKRDGSRENARENSKVEKKAKRVKKTAGSRKRPAELPLAELGGAPESAAPEPSAPAPPQRGPTRIDFDDRLIQGQTNKSGAVYLYERKELKQRSMIHQPESFREQIVGAVYGS